MCLDGISPGRQNIKWHVVLEVLGGTTDKVPYDKYQRRETWQDLDRQAANAVEPKLMDANFQVFY